MKRIFLLTATQVKELRENIKICGKIGDHRAVKRMEAIIFVGAENIPCEQAAKLKGIKRITVGRSITKYLKLGVAALYSKKRKYQRKITPEQEAEIQLVISKSPEEAGFSSAIWTCAMVCEVIKKKYGVTYHPHHMAQLMNIWQFSMQYPKQVLSKADKEKQKEWQENTIKDIKKKAEKENAIIMYEDEAVFQQNGTIIRGWYKKGKGGQVKSYPTRQSVKVFGALTITQKPKWHFRVDDIFNAETFQKFIQQIIRQYKRKIILILDNARYHHAKAINKYLETVKDKIELFFLPPYSPEFNPVESCWKLTKRDTHNKYFPSPRHLYKTLLQRFNRFQGNPAYFYGIVRSFL